MRLLLERDGYELDLLVAGYSYDGVFEVSEAFFLQVDALNAMAAGLVMPGLCIDGVTFASSVSGLKTITHYQLTELDDSHVGINQWDYLLGACTAYDRLASVLWYYFVAAVDYASLAWHIKLHLKSGLALLFPKTCLSHTPNDYTWFKITEAVALLFALALIMTSVCRV